MKATVNMANRSRREWLAAVGLVTTTAIAGCLGSQEEDSEPDPANFSITDSTEGNFDVRQGENLSADATIENTGDESDSQEVEFTFGDENSQRSISLEGSEDTTIS
ncbi:hypothetical protein RBH26_15465, partial [Natronolimnohabitans sp. A-GB9]|nr:hypothetical protein [Natronolimnohabitans sp. A-GB9]